jgi:small-conductance mechanosensitive channel
VPLIRFLRILWRMLPPLFVGGLLVLAAQLLGASDKLRQQAWIAAGVIVAFSLVGAVIQEVLSPNRAALRLVPMRTHRAERLMAVLKLLLLVLLGTELLIYVSEANHWNPAVARLLALLRNVGLIFFTGSALSRSGFFKSMMPDRIESYGAVLRYLVVRVFYPLALLTALFVAAAYALGYDALAAWVTRGSALSAVVIAVAACIHRYFRQRMQRMVAFLQAEEVQEVEVKIEEAVVRDAEERLEEIQAEEEREAGVRPAALAPAAEPAEESTEPPPPPPEPSPAWIGIERIVAGALKIAMLALTFFALLAVWELDYAAFQDLLDHEIFSTAAEGEARGLTYGNVVAAIFTVATVIVIGRLLRNLLIFIAFPRAKVDAGARYAILAIVRYLVIVVAVLMGVNTLGIDTSAFTYFAGAFGVGLAFGLQDIFANFFAGLIMLLERPVRVGDTIEVGGSSGRVEAIKLRGTNIRTFDNTTITIPNREMIGARLTNLLRDMEFGRITVSVGVSYGSDPAQVERVLLQVARRHPGILSDPEPFVRFTGFGDSSLDFVLRAYTDDVGGRWRIGSELNRMVFEAFGRADIEIPFPQRDLHIRSDVRSAPEA